MATTKRRATTAKPAPGYDRVTFEVTKDRKGSTLKVYRDGREVAATDDITVPAWQVYRSAQNAAVDALRGAAANLPRGTGDAYAKGYMDGVAEGSARAFDRLVGITVDSTLAKKAEAAS